ncbi:hypothetical protein FKM82_003030 [Ascaphus truei]
MPKISETDSKSVRAVKPADPLVHAGSIKTGDEGDAVTCTKHLQITGSPWSRAQMAPGCTPKLLRCLLLTALVNFTCGETIEGSVTAAQVERNPPSIRRGFILATNSDVQLSFMLHDPRNYFKSAVFIYRWNFGDRTRIVTGSAFASHNYSTAGTYTLSLQVSAHFQSSRHDRHTLQKTGSFTAALTLLGTDRCKYVCELPVNIYGHFTVLPSHQLYKNVLTGL